MIITIDNVEIRKIYEDMIKISEKYKTAKDAWKAGSIQPVYIDAIGFIPPKYVMPAVVGLIGETALHKAMMQLGYSDFPEPDLNLYVKGDNGSDFLYKGQILQVKTTSNPCLPLLVRREYHGQLLDLKFDKVISLFHKLNSNEVEIRGWCPLSTVMRMGLSEPRTKGYSPWRNASIGEHALHSITTIMEEK